MDDMDRTDVMLEEGSYRFPSFTPFKAALVRFKYFCHLGAKLHTKLKVTQV